MPLDDLRTRPTPPTPPLEERDHGDDAEQQFDELTPEAREACWQATLVELRRDLEDVKAGRLATIPWDDALNERLFDKLR